MEDNRKAMSIVRIRSAGAVLSGLLLLGFQPSPASGDDESYRSNLGEAVSVAHIDFVKKLEKWYAVDPHPSAERLNDYVRNPSSYSVGISETDDSYVVVFRLKQTPLFMNVVGGGAAYVIRKSDLSIVKFIGNK